MRFYNSIKYRLFFSSLAQVILTIVSLALIVLYTQREKYSSNSIKELQTLGGIVGESAETSILFEQLDEVLDIIKPFESNPKIEAIWVLVNNKEIASIKKDSTHVIPEKLTLEGLKNEKGIFSKSEIISDGEKLGEVVFMANSSQLESDLQALNGRILYTSIGLVVFFGVLVFVTQNSISNPISKLSSVAKKVKEGDLNARARIKTKDELRELGDTFNEMLSRIKYESEISDKILENRGKLFDNIGKELNSILNELTLSSEAIHTEKTDDKDQAQKINSLLESATKLRNTVSDILVATTKSGKELSFQNKELDLNDTLHQLAFDLQAIFEDRSLKFDLSTNFEFPVYSDANRIKEVLKFVILCILEEKAVNSIFLSASTRDQINFNFQFTCNKSDKIESILENLNNVDPKIQTDIKDLNLSSLKELIFIKSLSTSNGNLTYSIEDDQLKIDINLQLESSITRNKKQELESYAQQLNNKFVLLAEPSLKELELTKEIFEQHGASVITVKTGQDLYDFLGYNISNIDLVVLEPELPMEDGISVLRKIRNEHQLIPSTLIVTGNNNNALAKNAKDLGIKKILDKPTSSFDLIKAAATSLYSKG